MAEKFTAEAMFKKLAENDFDDTKFVLADGTTAVVTPCYYGLETPELKDIEYFLVSCEGLPWLSNDKLDKVADNFNNILKLRNEADEEKIALRKYFEENEKTNWADGDWGWYSDWHKDVYGYRPHGHVCGVYVNPNA